MKQLFVWADLQWEEDNSEANHCCDPHGHDDSLCVVEAGDHAHHVGEAQGQDRLQDTEKKQKACLFLSHVEDISNNFKVLLKRWYC